MYVLDRRLNRTTSNSYDVVTEYDSTIDYVKLKQKIDPNDDYKMSVFSLEHMMMVYD